jgi:hypothetical protein
MRDFSKGTEFDMNEQKIDHSEHTDEEKASKGIETEAEAMERAQKTEKPKKKNLAKPKAEKKLKAKAGKKDSDRPYVYHKGTKDDPKTGQSAPKTGKVERDKLNEKEREVLTALRRSGQKLSIAELSERVLSQNNIKAHGTSHVRNSLRRLVREGFVKKPERGAYKAAKKR